VQILENDHDGLPRGKLLDEVGHALKEAKIAATRGWQARRVELRQ